MRSSPLDPGARPSNSSDESTLMCSSIRVASNFGIAEIATFAGALFEPPDGG